MENDFQTHRPPARPSMLQDPSSTPARTESTEHRSACNGGMPQVSFTTPDYGAELAHSIQPPQSARQSDGMISHAYMDGRYHESSIMEDSGK